MELLKLYTVTKGNSSKEIQEEDFIWISENGDLNSVKGCGWLPREEYRVYIKWS